MKIKIQNLKSDKWQVTSDKQRNCTPPETCHSSPVTRHSAFTLVEMLLVVAIIGILAALVIPRIAGKSDEARKTAVYSDLHGGIKTALDNYEIDTGKYPASLNDLIQQPGDIKGWHGPYLDQLPADPWGQPYVYYYPSKHGQTYDLLSIGPDSKEGTDDDLGNWMAK